MRGTLLFLLFSLVVIVSCDKINFDNEQLDSIIRTKVELGAKIHHIAENLVESKVHYVVKKGALDALEYHKHSVSQLHLRKDLAQHADDLHMKLREFEIKLLEKDNNYFSVFNKRNLEDSNNSTQLKSNLLDLLSNFPQAKTWLAECNTATCINFIIELAGDNRDYYVAEFLELMISLNFTSPGITPELQDNFVLVMLQLFYKQTEHNPPLYVSHGTDHSVRAMSWVDQLQTLVDEGLETTYGSYSKNHSKFMLYLNTILHDTGYIWIESPKFLHAAASGILTDQFITTNTTNVGALMLNESAELNENLINDFIFALSTHNYDDQLCLFKTGDEYSKCLYIYEPAKKNITGITKNYTRDYVPVNAISKPFGFVVRIADNFDATYYRLTITQRHEFLVQFWLRLYTDFDLRTAVANKVDQNPALSAARENALNSMPELKAYYEDTNSQVKDIVDKSNSESFLHFYSNWIVQNMTYDNYVLTVNFRNPVEEELRYYHHPGPALYQVNRLASSMLSCYTASNTSFIDAIQVELNPPLPNATKSRFSLRSFTKKPIYDENGKNGFICTPHCDDLSFLTISPEPCLTYVNGQIAVSKECPYVDFGKVSPYSDLSYPNTTQTTTTSTTTSSTTGESVETSGSSIVTLCAFVMLFNLLVVVLF